MLCGVQVVPRPESEARGASTASHKKAWSEVHRVGLDMQANVGQPTHQVRGAQH